jgi:hypothetical protein
VVKRKQKGARRPPAKPLAPAPAPRQAAIVALPVAAREAPVAGRRSSSLARLLLASLLLSALGAAAGWWAGERSMAHQRRVRLLASMDDDPEMSVREAFDRARDWADQMQLDLFAASCLRDKVAVDRYQCDLLGEFSPTQPQIVTLACERRGCRTIAMGISAMPAP